jgi:hypothetical protein
VSVRPLGRPRAAQGRSRGSSLAAILSAVCRSSLRIRRPTSAVSVWPARSATMQRARTPRSPCAPARSRYGRACRVSRTARSPRVPLPSERPGRQGPERWNRSSARSRPTDGSNASNKEAGPPRSKWRLIAATHNLLKVHRHTLRPQPPEPEANDPDRGCAEPRASTSCRLSTPSREGVALVASVINDAPGSRPGSRRARAPRRAPASWSLVCCASAGSSLVNSR